MTPTQNAFYVLIMCFIPNFVFEWFNGKLQLKMEVLAC